MFCFSTPKAKPPHQPSPQRGATPKQTASPQLGAAAIPSPQLGAAAIPSPQLGAAAVPSPQLGAAAVPSPLQQQQTSPIKAHHTVQSPVTSPPAQVSAKVPMASDLTRLELPKDKILYHVTVSDASTPSCLTVQLLEAEVVLKIHALTELLKKTYAENRGGYPPTVQVIDLDLLG